MAGWDPRTNYGVGTKVSVPDYTSSFSGGPGSTGFSGFKYTPPQSWDPKGNNIGSTVDWDKAANLKFDGINYQEPVFNPEREERDKLFNDLFEKTKSTDKWKQASMKGGGGPTSDFGVMPGIGAQCGKVGDNLSFCQPASPTSMVIPGSGGMGGPIGTLAGIAASFIPGLGPGIAAALPSIGGTIGGAIG